MDSIFARRLPGRGLREKQGNPAEEGGSAAFPYLKSPEGIVITRWAFSQEERKRIADGEDLYLSVLTSNGPFPPVKLDVGVPFDGTENLKRKLRLADEKELRELVAQRNETVNLLKERQLMLVKADGKCQELGKMLEREEKALRHKEAEVFSDKPAPKIEVVQ